MKATTMYFYVCDRCANQWRGYRSLMCPACHHKSIWQFDDRKRAAQHAADIRNPHVSVERPS